MSSRVRTARRLAGWVATGLVIALVAATGLTGATPTKESTVSESSLPDFDSLWDYNHPDSTEAKFREVWEQTSAVAPLAYKLELQTQIARTYGLQQRFEDSHAMLDEVEAQLNQAVADPAMSNDLDVAKVRYLLERGRTFRSAGSREEARPFFREAWDTASKAGADFYAVDAAHMMAIIEPPEAATDWFEKGCRVAEGSDDARARGWLGPLYNNLAWTYHDAGNYETALDVFEKALAWREQEGKTVPIRIARYSVARCLRSLERYDEALAIQRALIEELEAAGEEDGYVFEEMGELLLATRNQSEAVSHFAKAHALLSQDPWLSANEPERLARLERLARGTGP